MNNRPQVLFTDQDDATRQMASIHAIERIQERHVAKSYFRDRIFPPKPSLRHLAMLFLVIGIFLLAILVSLCWPFSSSYQPSEHD